MSGARTCRARPSRASLHDRRRDGTADLFVSPEKMTDAVHQHLGNAVRVHDRLAFAPALRHFAGKRVAIDPLAVSAIFDAVEAGGGIAIPVRDHTIIPKATKNEVVGHRAASIRDGVALTRFALDRGRRAAGPNRAVRRRTPAAVPRGYGELARPVVRRDLRDRPQRALPHYHVTSRSNRAIEPGQLYLIDLGGAVSRRHHRT